MKLLNLIILSSVLCNIRELLYVFCYQNVFLYLRSHIPSKGEPLLYNDQLYREGASETMSRSGAPQISKKIADLTLFFKNNE